MINDVVRASELHDFDSCWGNGTGLSCACPLQCSLLELWMSSVELVGDSDVDSAEPSNATEDVRVGSGGAGAVATLRDFMVNRSIGRFDWSS